MATIQWPASMPPWTSAMRYAPISLSVGSRLRLQPMNAPRGLKTTTTLAGEAANICKQIECVDPCCEQWSLAASLSLNLASPSCGPG